MRGRRTEPAQRGQVLWSRIPHVVCEAVAAMTLVEATHERVSMHLGDDRRRRNRAVLGVAVHDGRLLDRHTGHLPRIDEQMIDLELLAQRDDRSPHRFE